MPNKTSSLPGFRQPSLLSVVSLYLVLALIFSTPLFLMGNILPQQVKIYRLYGYGILFVLQVVLFSSLGWQRSARIYATPSIAVLIWFCVSVLWADHFDLSVRRVFLVLLIYSSVFSGVMILGYKRSIDAVRFFLVLVLIVNLITVFMFPQVGIQKWLTFYLWRGLLADKNIAGVASATTIILFLIDSHRIKPHLRVLVVSGAAIFLYMSWSRTAMIAFIFSLVIGLSISRFAKYISPYLRNRREPISICIWVTYAAVISIVAYLTFEREVLISLTNDASGLSLRNSIWRPMIEYYLDHPFLGSGYGSYWDASVRFESDTAFSTQKWLKKVDQGHSGYLDLLVQTGFLGLVLAIWAAIFWPMTQFIAMIERQPNRAALTFSLLTFFIIENVTESSLFSDDALGNLFVILALAQVHRFKTQSINQVVRQRNKIPSSTNKFRRYTSSNATLHIKAPRRRSEDNL